MILILSLNGRRAGAATLAFADPGEGDRPFYSITNICPDYYTVIATLLLPLLSLLLLLLFLGLCYYYYYIVHSEATRIFPICSRRPCVRLGLYIYIYIYIYIYTHTYAHTCVYIYIYIHTYTSMIQYYNSIWYDNMYVYIYIYVYINTHMYMCIYIYICIHLSIYLSIYLSLSLSIYIYIYIYIYICSRRSSGNAPDEPGVRRAAAPSHGSGDCIWESKYHYYNYYYD